MVADPLRLDAVRHQRVRDAGRDLHAGVPGEQRLDERPRRSPLVGRERPAPRRTPGRVGERDVEPRVVERGRVGDLDGASEAQGVEVGGGDRDPLRVEVHTRRRQAGGGERDQVAADAAAEVDDRTGVEGSHPRRAVRRDGQPGGLLEPLGGEVHPCGQVAELRDRRPAQRGLGEGDGDPWGRDVRRRTTQRVVRGQRVVLDGGALPDGRGQHLLTVVGQQPGEGVEVHRGILAEQAWGAVGTPPGRVLVSTLALSSWVCQLT